jgi:hypothetical protein
MRPVEQLLQALEDTLSHESYMDQKALEDQAQRALIIARSLDDTLISILRATEGFGQMNDSELKIAFILTRTSAMVCYDTLNRILNGDEGHKPGVPVRVS